MTVLEASRVIAPSYEPDFYSDAVVEDPYPHYRAMRDLGPAVWLPANDAFAITRFADVRQALRDPERFVSGRGVMMNAPVNDGASGTSVLTTDGPAHAALRSLIGKPLTPAGLAPIRADVRSMAEALVDRLIAAGRFDGVADFSHYLPLLLVARLVGLPEEGRERMLDWAGGIFNVMGSLNHRFANGITAQQAALAYLADVDPARMEPTSWGARLFALAAAGEMSEAQARSALFDYITPALDTTIAATASTLWLLGTNPDQWDLLAADPGLTNAAVDEGLRLEAPIRAFSRYVAENADVDGKTVPAGSRALIVYASANRDERRWPDPDRYDIRRKAPQEHMSFGTGVHMCLGMHLARLEMRCLFEALARRVARFSVGMPQRSLHNVIRAIDSFEVTIEQVKDTP